MQNEMTNGMIGAIVGDIAGSLLNVRGLPLGLFERT